MISSALSFTPQVLIGFLLVVILFQENVLLHLPLKIALGTGIGLGISSCLYFFWSLLFDPGRKTFFLLESTLIFVLLYILFRSGNNIFTGFPGFPSFSNRLQKILFGFSVIVIAFILINVLLDFYYVTTMNPHGWYDTYTIWDYRARMIFRGGAYWFESFSPEIWHSDYPLLVPLNVASGWLLLGRENQQVPAFLAILFSFSLAGLLFGALNQLRDYSQAFVATLIILGTAEFLNTSANQLADTPLAYYILGIGVLSALYTHIPEKRPALLEMGGLFAGFAAWTKNEGAFVLVFSVLMLCLLKVKMPWRKLLASLLYFFAGLALPLAAFLVFKIWMAPPPSDVLSIADTRTLTLNLSDLNRYSFIARKLAESLWSFSLSNIPVLLILPVYGVILNINQQRRQLFEALTALLLVLFLLLVYFANYLTSPLDLNWYLVTSRSRVVWQLFPTLLLALFLLIKSPKQVFLNRDIISL